MNRRRKQLILTLNPGRSLRCAAWSIVYFLLATTLFVCSVIKGKEDAYIVLAIAGFSLPGCIIHLSYRRLEKGRKVTLSGKAIRIDSSTTGGSVVVHTGDICEVYHHSTTASSRAPWYNYEYIEIYLHTGERHIITSLLVDIDIVARYLYLDRQQQHECRRFFPVITKSRQTAGITSTPDNYGTSRTTRTIRTTD